MIKLTVPGKPGAKQRPRMTRTGHVYTPKATRSFEDVVRQIAAVNVPEPYTGAVRVHITAMFDIPASWSKKKQAESLNQPHTQRPDLDNIVKAVTDGLNRIAYIDDGQIAVCCASKWWVQNGEACVIVEISEMEEER